MKKPKSIEELRKVAATKIEEENYPERKGMKSLAKKDKERGRMMGLLESLMALLKEKDQEEMEEEKAKKSTPTSKAS